MDDESKETFEYKGSACDPTIHLEQVTQIPQISDRPANEKRRR